MSMVLDPVATLDRHTLVFRQQPRAEAEVAPRLGRILPTGGYTFVEEVREKLAMIVGLTIAELLPEGGAPPRVEVPTDRLIQVYVQHEEPQQAARSCAAKLWRLGHACRIEERSLAQVEIRLERLPIKLRFVPDRRALLRHLHERCEGQRLQGLATAGIGG